MVANVWFMAKLVVSLYLSLLPTVLSLSSSSLSLMETKLPIFYSMEVAKESSASSPLMCSLECIQIGCVGFLFKTEDFVEDNHCYSTPSSLSYNGTVAVTINGNTCMNWADKYPHNHPYDATYMPENSLTEAVNYCRDPEGTGLHWCYTTDPNIRWEPCDIYPCLYESYEVDENQCYSNQTSSSYNGTLAVTINGNTCQNWADQYPHSHEYDPTYFTESSLTEVRNYCRDPTHAGFNWCFTTDTDIRWEMCDIHPCTSETKTCRMFSTRSDGISEYRAGYIYYNTTSYNTFK